MRDSNEGWRIAKSYYVDERGRVVSSVSNLTAPDSAFWHVENFDPETGYLIEDDYCYSYNEAIELATYFVNRSADHVR